VDERYSTISYFVVVALLAAGLATPGLLMGGTRAAHAMRHWETVRKRGNLVTAKEMQFALAMIGTGK